MAKLNRYKYWYVCTSIWIPNIVSKLPMGWWATQTLTRWTIWTTPLAMPLIFAWITITMWTHWLTIKNTWTAITTHSQCKRFLFTCETMNYDIFILKYIVYFNILKKSIFNCIMHMLQPFEYNLSRQLQIIS